MKLIKMNASYFALSITVTMIGATENARAAFTAVSATTTTNGWENLYSFTQPLSVPATNTDPKSCEYRLYFETPGNVPGGYLPFERALLADSAEVEIIGAAPPTNSTQTTAARSRR